LGITVLALTGLLSWQFASPIALQRSSLEQQATQTIQQVVQQQSDLQYLSADVSYTQATQSGDGTLLALVYVQEPLTSTTSDAAMRQRLSSLLKAELNETLSNTTPLVNVTVLEP
jgi:chaperonin GroEL (HSP60 family)